MNLRIALLICCAATVAGAGWYAYLNEWVIIRNPWHGPYHTQVGELRIHKKEVPLFFWSHDRWRTEKVSLALSEHVQEQTLAILQAWFHEAFQSHFIHTSCTVEAALVDQRAGCLYISCSTSPFDTQNSTYATLMIFESLTKTVRASLPKSIQSLCFLVHDKLLEHPHLDCTRPLPLSGFHVLPH